MSIKLYLATGFNMSKDAVKEFREKGFHHYFMSLGSAFASKSAKYFTREQDAICYDKARYKDYSENKDSDCKAIFTIEVEYEKDDKGIVVFPVKRFVSVYFPRFDETIDINLDAEEMLKRANGLRNPDYQTLFNLKGFACTKENFGEEEKKKFVWKESFDKYFSFIKEVEADQLGSTSMRFSHS